MPRAVAPAAQLVPPTGPRGGVVGRGEDLGAVGDLRVDVAVGRERRRPVDRPRDEWIERHRVDDSLAALAHRSLAATVRRASSSKPMPSKPTIVVASRFCSGSIQVDGKEPAPARAPQTEPTVAPTE